MEIKEQVGTFGRFKIYLGIETDDTDRIENKDEWKGNDFIIACERVQKIFDNIEKHDDFENLMKKVNYLNRISNIVNEYQAEDSEKRLDLERKLEDNEEEYPF